MESIEQIKLAEQEAAEALQKAQQEAEKSIREAAAAAEDKYAKMEKELLEKKALEEKLIQDQEEKISSAIIAPYKKQADTLMQQVSVKKQEVLRKLEDFFNVSVS